MMVNYKWLMVNVRESLVNQCHPEATCTEPVERIEWVQGMKSYTLENSNYTLYLKSLFHSKLIFLFSLILFLVNCDLKVKTNNAPLFKLMSLFQSNGANNTVATPLFSPAPGTYSTDQSIILSTTTSGATIYYTLDGSIPTISSTLYSGAISIAGNGTTKTIQAFAVKSGMVDSGVSTGTWTIDNGTPIVTITALTTPYVSINSGAINFKEISWSSNKDGSYSVKVGGSDCNTGGTILGTGSVSANGNNIYTVNASSLSVGANTIRFCVTDAVSTFIGTNSTIITRDDLAPVAGNSGTLIAQSGTSSSLTLNWTKGNDTATTQTNLQYKVMKSLSNNIDTITNAEANGTLIQDWTVDINTASVTGLTANTLYYIGVLIKDQAGNKAMYVVKSITFYTISGTITGLTSNGLVLQNNGANSLSIPSDSTSFIFGASNGSTYSITVSTQPTGMSCIISSGSGTANSNITNVSISCISNVYDWGTFADNNNGTIRFDGNAGTFGGNTYSTQTLTWMKCSQGQSWNSSANDCTGTGNSGNNYGAMTFQYCTLNDNSCNSNITWLLNGTGSSTAYSTCDSLIFAGISNWRVPTKEELKILINCNDKTMPTGLGGCGVGNTTSPTINNLFSNTIPGAYLSSTAYDNGSAWNLSFGSGGAVYYNKNWSFYYVRCVSP